jgi:hypothetical protein
MGTTTTKNQQTNGQTEGQANGQTDKIYSIFRDKLSLPEGSLIGTHGRSNSPWIHILAGRLKDRDCPLSMTDSTTSEG